VKLCAATGVAALSIEDSTGDKAKPLYDIETGVARIKAARAALDASAPDTMLVGRAECFLVGITDIDEVTRRLKAYADAGADCLYAPGIRSREHIEAVVKAVAPKPVNLLIGGAIGITMADAAAMGVRRVSVGGSLARAAWGGFIRAAQGLKDGHFDGFKDAAPHPDLQGFFRDDLAKRGS
jgi:2-methylisocitrate lyase-like PEP mutase family enzyme